MKNIHTTTIIIIIALFCVAIITGGYLFIYRGSVHFTLAPDTAEIVIDTATDRKVIHDNDRLYLTPGKHTVTFYRNDFSIERIELTIHSFKSQDQLVALTPLNEASKKIMQTNQNQTRLKEYSASKKNTLFSLLPISNADYTIESCKSLRSSSDTQGKALCISEITSGGVGKAQRYLLSIGYDPSAYEVYTGDTTSVKVVYATDLYTISYPINEHLDKPVLAILFKEPLPQSALPLKEMIRTGLTQHGYNPDNYYLFFLNPQLTQQGTMPGNTELFD